MKKWKTFLALICMIFAILYEWGWFWIALILLGIIYALQTQKIHFVEEISKKETPILYWTLLMIWLGIAIYSIIEYSVS